MPPVNLLIKPASGLCNMQCDYCFYCDETKKRSQESFGLMSDKTLKNVIRRTVLAAEGSCTIVFQGGEPTLCGLDFFESVVQYVQQYNRNHIHIEYALQTNGYDITEEWCRFFSKHHFLIGVSVDGTKAIHDRYRHDRAGHATYERIMKTIRMFDAYHVDYNILTVVHKDVAKNIKDIYNLYKSNGWRYLQFITCLDPLEEEHGKQPYSLLPETYGQFLVDLFSLWFEDFKKNQQPFIRQFENYISIMLGFGTESCEQRGTCGIQNVVEADGSVFPCDFYALDEYCLGNLNEVRLNEIYKRRDEIGFIRRSLNHPDSCKNCKWYKLCRGGCYRSRLNGPDEVKGLNYFCGGYKYFFEKCIGELEEAARIVQMRMK